MSTIKKAGEMKRTSSGDHPIIKTVQAQIASIRANELTQAKELDARVDRLKENSAPPIDENEIARLIREGRARKSQPDIDEEGDTLPGIQVSVPSPATTLPAPPDDEEKVKT